MLHVATVPMASTRMSTPFSEHPAAPEQPADAVPANDPATATPPAATPPTAPANGSTTAPGPVDPILQEAGSLADRARGDLYASVMSIDAVQNGNHSGALTVPAQLVGAAQAIDSLALLASHRSRDDAANFFLDAGSEIRKVAALAQVRQGAEGWTPEQEIALLQGGRPVVAQVHNAMLSAQEAFDPKGPALTVPMQEFNLMQSPMIPGTTIPIVPDKYFPAPSQTETGQQGPPSAPPPPGNHDLPHM